MPLDTALFNEQMKDSSILAILLKGHLWTESCLNRALDISFKEPNAANLDRVPFSAKLDLALASGALTKDEVAPLRALNKLRNRLAHELDVGISEQNIRDLEGTLTGKLKVGYNAVHEEELNTKDRLHRWLLAVLTVVEYENMIREYEKVNAQGLNTYRLIRALEERGGFPRTPDDELMQTYGVPDPPNARDAWTGNGRNATAH